MSTLDYAMITISNKTEGKIVAGNRIVDAKETKVLRISNTVQLERLMALERKNLIVIRTTITDDILDTLNGIMLYENSTVILVESYEEMNELVNLDSKQRVIMFSRMNEELKEFIFINGKFVPFQIAGPKGERGPRGEDGKDGMRGEQGPRGFQGVRGADGERGQPGPQGPAGQDGEDGEKGEKGDTGPKGEKGDAGPQGPQGLKGDKGDTGPTGKDGSKGDTGPQGLKGEKGDTGPAGKDGEKGEKGDTGPQGPQGIPGKDFLYEQFTKEQLELLRGPQGEKGDTGPQGLKGDAGAKGDTGPQGPQGPQGLKGDAGPQGLKGDTGPQGLKGDKGDTGPAGKNGSKGDTGPQGPQGLKGEQGIPGKDFLYEQFTKEQLELLRGPQGLPGEATNNTQEIHADMMPLEIESYPTGYSICRVSGKVAKERWSELLNSSNGPGTSFFIETIKRSNSSYLQRITEFLRYDTEKTETVNIYHMIKDGGYAPQVKSGLYQNNCITKFGNTSIGSKHNVSGTLSTANGTANVITGNYSFVTGSTNNSDARTAFVAGYQNDAQNYLVSVLGTYNQPQEGALTFVKSGSSLLEIGNGTSVARSNALRLSHDGDLQLSGKIQSPGADYAEMFEWADGNVDGEDRVGLAVTLDGEKIKLAQKGDYILGVISARPAILGDHDEVWVGKYKVDKFGRPKPTTITETHSYVDEYGNDVEEEVTVDTFELSDEWNKGEKYVPRLLRKEWSPVGVLGKLVAIDDGTSKVNGFADVDENGIFSTSTSGYRVMKRIDGNTILLFCK